MRPVFVVAIVFALVGAVLCAGVAIHEWNYHENHPYATGVSGVLTALGAGAALGCVAVALIALTVGRGRGG